MESATKLSAAIPSVFNVTIAPDLDSHISTPSNHPMKANAHSESVPLSSSPQHTSQKPLSENLAEGPPIDKEDIPEVRLEDPESVRTSRPLILPDPIIAEHEIHKSPSVNAYFSAQGGDIDVISDKVLAKAAMDSKLKDLSMSKKRLSQREDSYREDPPAEQKRSSIKKKKSLVSVIGADEPEKLAIAVKIETVRESVHTMIRYDQPEQEISNADHQLVSNAPEREGEVAIEVRGTAEVREPEAIAPAGNVDEDDNENNSDDSQELEVAQEDVVNNIPAPEVLEANTVNALNAMAINREENNRIVKQEIALKLRLCMALFFFSFLCASFLRTSILDNDRIPQKSFIVLYVFFFWVMLERSYRFKHPFLNNWQKRENLFDIIDLFGYILIILLFNLKVSGRVVHIGNVFLFPLGVTLLYVFFSQAPKGPKETRILNRLIITVQIFLLFRKIDGSLDWDWVWAIVLIIFYLGMVALYCLLLILTVFFMLLLLMCGLGLYGTLDKKTQFIGIIWNLLFTSLSVVVLLGSIGASQGTPDSTTVFLDSLRSFQFMCIILTAYTGFFFNFLATFMFHFATEESNRNTRIGIQTPATISIEKAKTYFVMLSSTYFVELKNSFVIKDKNKLEKMKATLENAKAKKNTPIFIKKIQSLLVKIPEGLQARVENFKKDKVIFDKHFVGQEIKARNINEEHVHNLSELQINKESFDIASPDENTKKHKVWLSEGDDAGFACIESEASQKDENSGLCYICFTNEANSIMVDCGHGGVCYECAVEFLKRKGQCMECRGKVTQVAKVKVERGLKNIVIGDEVGKLKEISLF